MELGSSQVRWAHTPAKKGWSGSSSCAQVVQTRCGSLSWNLGGSIIRSRQQASQKMKPHSRQWCRSRVSGLQHGATGRQCHDIRFDKRSGGRM